MSEENLRRFTCNACGGCAFLEYGSSDELPTEWVRVEAWEGDEDKIGQNVDLVPITEPGGPDLHFCRRCGDAALKLLTSAPLIRDLDDALERVTLNHTPDCLRGVAVNECTCGLARVHELRAELRRAVGGGA